MCLGKTPSPPPVPPVPPAPTREQVAAAQRAQDAKDATVRIKSVVEAASKDAKRQGIYSNVKSSRSGDWFYGKRTREPIAYFGKPMPVDKSSAGAATFGSA